MAKYDNLLYYAQAYLEFAQLGCQELLSPSHNKTEHVSGWDMRYSPLIVYPIIFNTKHGIECFLKVLQQIAGENYDTIHNLHRLFDAVHQIMESQKWVHVEDDGDEITQEDIKNMPNVLTEIECLVDYFYNNKMLNEKLGIGDVPDPMNELFRYPVMKAGSTFDHDVFLSKIEESDIKELKAKITKLYDNLNNMGYFIAVSLRQP